MARSRTKSDPILRLQTMAALGDAVVMLVRESGVMRRPRRRKPTAKRKPAAKVAVTPVTKSKPKPKGGGPLAGVPAAVEA